MTRMTSIARLAAATALAGLAALPAWAEDYTIGALFPLSGPNAVYGDVFMAGSDLAVEHVNADDMLSGDLSIAYEDSQGLPQPAVVGMTKLINVTGVPYVLSAFTGVSKAISALGQRAEVVAVNGGGVGPDLAALGEYFWNVIPLANLEVRAMVPYLAEQGMKKVVLVYIDDPMGAAMEGELEAELAKVGGELVEVLSVPTTAQQFSGVAAKVRAAEADVVYVASYGAQQLQLVKQLRDNGVEARLATYSGYAVPDALALPESEGMLVTGQAVTLDAEDPVTRRFVEDFRARNGGADPTAYNVNYYNATLLFAILAQALEAEGKEVTGPNLLAKRKEIGSFDLVGGTVSFQDNGTLLFPIQIKQITGGGTETLTSVEIE